MPEGPEVAVIADAIREYTHNFKLVSITPIGSRDPLNIQVPSNIEQIQSHGKKLIMKLESGQYMVFSFGMTGGFSYIKTKFSRYQFLLGSNEREEIKYLYFNGKGRVPGGIEVAKSSDEMKKLLPSGPDLMVYIDDEETWMDETSWMDLFDTKKGQRTAMHSVLTDQQRLAGIGWYLMTDILYHSGVHPKTLLKDVTQDQLRKMRSATFELMKLSYESGGATIESYAAPDGTVGKYPFSIYSRDTDDEGRVVIKEKLNNGRTLRWVEEAIDEALPPIA